MHARMHTHTHTLTCSTFSQFHTGGVPATCTSNFWTMHTNTCHFQVTVNLSQRKTFFVVHALWRITKCQLQLKWNNYVAAVCGKCSAAEEGASTEACQGGGGGKTGCVGGEKQSGGAAQIILYNKRVGCLHNGLCWRRHWLVIVSRDKTILFQCCNNMETYRHQTASICLVIRDLFNHHSQCQWWCVCVVLLLLVCVGGGGVLFFQLKCLDIVVLFSQHFLPAPVFKHNYNVYYIYIYIWLSFSALHPVSVFAVFRQTQHYRCFSLFAVFRWRCFCLSSMIVLFL